MMKNKKISIQIIISVTIMSTLSSSIVVGELKKKKNQITKYNFSNKENEQVKSPCFFFLRL